MSKVNFSRNIFLEKEELVRFQQLLLDDAKKFILKHDVSTFGIVAQPSLLGLDFLVQAGSTGGTFKIVNDSYAVDSDLLLISLKAFDNFPITNNSLWYWVKISHRYLNTEVGTVSINTAGEISGSGTLFSEVLRSQTSKAPVKIKFYKENSQGVPLTVNNDSIYEVVSIVNNTNASLSGNFVAETDLKYIVVGGVSLGAALTTEQKAGLYSYDNCQVSLVQETVLNTPPTAGYTSDKDFYIARVKNDGGSLTIQDKRTQYFATQIAISETSLKSKINYADSQIVSGLSDDVAAVIVDGCSAVLNAGQLELSAGSVKWNGEIFQVLAQSVSDIGESGIYYFSVDPSSLALPVRKLLLAVGTSVPGNAVQFAHYYYGAIVLDILPLESYLMKPQNNLSDLTNKSSARTNLGVYAKTDTVERHSTGTNSTRPTLTGWTLDLSTTTASGSFPIVNLWKYQLPEKCHILRIYPKQSPCDHTADPTLGDRPTLYKILPPAGIYDGYELQVYVDCTDTAPIANKSRHFAVLGDLAIVNGGTSYSGNIVFSRVEEKIISQGGIYSKKWSNDSNGQLVCVAANDLGAAMPASIVYAQVSLILKFRWYSNKQKWIQEGISQPYVS